MPKVGFKNLGPGRQKLKVMQKSVVVVVLWVKITIKRFVTLFLRE